MTTEAAPARCCGRPFSRAELDQLRQLIAAHPAASRAQLSRLVCGELDWEREDGRLKEMICRAAMLRMQTDGLLHPAPPRDHYIGWTPAQRQDKLHRVVNNARFPILPWIECKNLASLILARAARMIAAG